MVKAVILDLDGTLINSHPAHVKSFKEMLKKHKLKVNKLDFSKYFGLIAEDILKKIFPTLTKKKITMIARTKKELFIKEINLITKQPCADKLISQLKNKKTAIATSASREEMMAVIKKFNWDFNAKITSYEVEKPKPSPDILIEAIKQLGVNIEESLFIGDSIYDADTARKAGMKFIGVATGSYTISDFKKKGVKAYQNLCRLISAGVLQNL